MKDVTVTSFGLVIAYLLPGFTGLYGLRFWSPFVDSMLNTFLTTQANIGLFLIVLLASLVLGLFANGIRAFFYEIFFFSSHRVHKHRDAALSDDGCLSAYRLVIDENYRYSQWWGGTAAVLPIALAGRLYKDHHDLQSVIGVILLFAFVEYVCLHFAGHQWCRTVERLNQLFTQETVMGGNPHHPPDPPPPPPPTR